MLRYTKQRDEFSCGPIAILNALIWAGADAAHDKCYAWLRELCDCTPPNGTQYAPFERALKSAGQEIFQVRKIMRPSMSTIDDHLQSGQALVLNYLWKTPTELQRHYVLMVGTSESGGSYYTVNNFRQGPALARETREKFKDVALRFIYGNDRHYKAWFLFR